MPENVRIGSGLSAYRISLPGAASLPEQRPRTGARPNGAIVQQYLLRPYCSNMSHEIFIGKETMPAGNRPSEAGRDSLRHHEYVQTLRPPPTSVPLFPLAGQHRRSL